MDKSHICWMAKEGHALPAEFWKMLEASLGNNQSIKSLLEIYKVDIDLVKPESPKRHRIVLEDDDGDEPPLESPKSPKRRYGEAKDGERVELSLSKWGYEVLDQAEASLKKDKVEKEEEEEAERESESESEEESEDDGIDFTQEDVGRIYKIKTTTEIFNEYEISHFKVLKVSKGSVLKIMWLYTIEQLTNTEYSDVETLKTLHKSFNLIKKAGSTALVKTDHIQSDFACGEIANRITNIARWNPKNMAAGKVYIIGKIKFGE
jgi:hypothetical protein